MIFFEIWDFGMHYEYSPLKWSLSPRSRGVLEGLDPTCSISAVSHPRKVEALISECGRVGASENQLSEMDPVDGLIGASDPIVRFLICICLRYALYIHGTTARRPFRLRRPRLARASRGW